MKACFTCFHFAHSWRSTKKGAYLNLIQIYLNLRQQLKRVLGQNDRFILKNINSRLHLKLLFKITPKSRKKNGISLIHDIREPF